jgi:hypothetical protein
VRLLVLLASAMFLFYHGPQDMSTIPFAIVPGIFSRGLSPFHSFLLTTTLSHYQISLVIVTGKSTGVQALTRWEADVPEPEYDRVVEALLRSLECCAGRQVVGLVVTGVHSYNSSSRSKTLSMVRSALHGRSTELEVQETECQGAGAACRGIFYDIRDDEMEQVIVGSPSCSIEMATAPSSTCAGDALRLFGPDVNLPRPTSKSLTLSLSEQKGVLLRLFARNHTCAADPYLSIETAIQCPNRHLQSTFSLKASMTFGQAVHLLLLASDGHYLAATHYSLDGLVSIESKSPAVITPFIRKNWLPKVVSQEDTPLSASSDDEASPPHATNGKLSIIGPIRPECALGIMSSFSKGPGISLLCEVPTLRKCDSVRRGQ